MFKLFVLIIEGGSCGLTSTSQVIEYNTQEQADRAFELLYRNTPKLDVFEVLKLY